MSGLLDLALANALASGLLALLAWALSRRIRRQTLVHGLWVLALVKLVTPPLVPLPLIPEWRLPSLGLPDGPATVVVEADSPRPGPPGPPAVSADAALPAPTAEASAAPESMQTSTAAALQAKAPALRPGPRAPDTARSVLDPRALAWTGTPPG